MHLLEIWRDWASKNADGAPPYIFDADREHERLNRLKARGRIDLYGDRDEAKRDPSLKTNRLNLRILPYPFIGDVESATIVVLMANPNAPHDAYYGPGWDKNKHIDNLKQDFSDMELPFESFNRQPISADYWYIRLRGTIRRIAKEKGLLREEALALVAKNVAVIQRSPYWSSSFVGGLERLPSARLALSYVQNEVVQRVKHDNTLLIVARRVRDWDQGNLLSDQLASNPRFITKANRFGSLNPNTAGGQAILRHFGIEE